MKKFITTTLLLTISAASLLAQTVWTNRNRVLPDKLRELPVGIVIYHDPNPCYPVKEGDTYYWKHSTYAMAIKPGLTVVECGSFIWYDASGWHANMKYTPEDFNKAFECPDGILNLNQTYTYKKNWRYGQQAYGGDALWYIIAKDQNGKLYKGIALIETEDKVIKKN